MNLVAANRFSADTRTAIGTFSQLVPVTVRTAGLTWRDQVRQASVATIKALMRGAYDPCSLDRLRDETPFDFTLGFNDMRNSVAPVSGQVLEPERGTVRWGTPNNAGDSTVYLWIWGRPEKTGMRLMVDTERLSLAQAEQFLTGVESVLVDASVAER
jgi:hypothetical protein